MWAFISDNDEWDRVCHQSGDEVPPNVLEEAGDFSHVPWEQTDERYYYAPLCATMNKLLDLCNSKYTMKVTGLNPETQQNAGMKPDLCVYEGDRNGPAYAAFTLPSTMEENKVDDESVAPRDDNTRWSSDAPQQVLDAIRLYQARTVWAWMTMLIQVKADPAAIPFTVDKDGNLTLSQTKAARKACTQIAQYASEVLLRQHRTFFFTAVLVERKAYLMRWDRAGVIVTTPFDYIDEPTKLLRFIYRVAVADRSLQGYDSTVTLASQEDAKIFKAYRDTLSREPVPSQKSNLPEMPNFLLNYANRALADEHLYPIHKVTFHEPPNVHSGSPDLEASCEIGVTSHHAATPVVPTGPAQTYLIGKQHHGSRSPTGRGGKGFVAFDIARGRSVFLKDYWYADHPTVHPETEVYQKLAQANVQYVATLLAGGDVVDDLSGRAQETLSQNYLTGARRRRRHHRLVVEEIGRPLESFQIPSQLVAALYEALIAHRDAWEKADILHRDISVANILINVETGKAFLNDWDLCRYRNELSMEASQHARSGTWPYMSATLVTYPRKPNELADDIESLLHSFTLTVLRFFKHSLLEPGETVHPRLINHVNLTYFGAREKPGGFYQGLGGKMDLMRDGRPGFRLKNPNSLVGKLLARWFELGAEHYAGLDDAKLAKDWGLPDAVQAKSPLSPFVPTSLPTINFHTARSNFQPHTKEHTPTRATDPSTFVSVDGTSTGVGKVASTAVPPRGPDGTRRTFNSHCHIIDIFVDIIEEYYGAMEAADKVDDQFGQLSEFIIYGVKDSHSTKGSSDGFGIYTGSVPKKPKGTRSSLQPARASEAGGSRLYTS